MIVELGHFALCLALVAAVIQSGFPLWGLRADNAAAMRSADGAAQVQFVAIAASFAALTYAFLVSDFSVRLVALNSHTAKPLIYKISGVWANHEGSMLLWVLILALFGALVSVFGRALPLRMRSTVLAVQGLIGVGFLGFILATSNPFGRLAAPPLDGQGMNPLLQDPGVALHPPLLYVGYVGFSTAYSFAVAALILGRVDASWARWMRPWILLAWAGLTGGIALGSWWAYYELGWGGFWFWDPVENASFMPWLVGTALLHSAIVVEKRSALIAWTILLAIFTFGLSLIGTFLVRSGILSSVHAFATDPERGLAILFLLGVALCGSMALFAWRAPKLNDNGTFGLVSRESGLLVNNLLLTAACAVVFLGTLYPLFLELVTGDKITVGAPYFNKTFLPIFAAVMIAAGIGPMLSWKRAKARDALKAATAAGLAALLITVTVASIAGLRDPAGLFGLFVATWLLVVTAMDAARRIGLGKTTLGASVRRAVGLPASAWALWIGHGGLAVAAAGVVAVSVWKVEAIQVQEPGTAVQVGPYAYVLEGIERVEGPNYQASVAAITVIRDGQAITELRPERRWYPVEKKPTTEAGITSHWHGDFYAVLGDPDGAGGFVTRYYYNPGVPWMWLGATLIVLSGLISVADRRLRVGVPVSRPRVPAQVPPPVPAE
jgi:cytochrome c-type biogenesis protein CcmF